MPGTAAGCPKPSSCWWSEPGPTARTLASIIRMLWLSPGSDEYSMDLALQQIAPYLRPGDPLPATFTVPIVREERRPKLVASYGSTKVAEFATGRNGKRRRT